MPIHLNYQGTACKECGAEFISFCADCCCPKCGACASESFGFVEATIATMKDHKQLYGAYFPDSWFSGSAADLVQGIIFELFDNLEIEKPKDVNEFISRQLTEAEFEEGMGHLVKQAEEIAFLVYELYRRDPDFRGDNLKNKPLNPKLENLNPENENIDFNEII